MNITDSTISTESGRIHGLFMKLVLWREKHIGENRSLYSWPCS